MNTGKGTRWLTSDCSHESAVRSTGTTLRGVTGKAIQEKVYRMVFDGADLYTGAATLERTHVHAGWNPL